MKVENLEQARRLNNALSQVEDKIKKVNKSKSVKMDGFYRFAPQSEDLKYGGDLIFEVTKNLFLQMLQKEKDYLISEIGKLD